MDRHPTYDDVNLILRLYELRREEKLRQARDWYAKNFRPKTMEEYNQLCPPGSEANAYSRMVIGYWEMAASFITSGVLNQELFFQYGGELLLVYERIRHVLPQLREFMKNPATFQNLETVGKAFRDEKHMAIFL